jgi:hypothetical protein
MILGIIITHNNEQETDENGETVRQANQSDFDRF